jgi:FkbM family methyltransferase
VNFTGMTEGLRRTSCGAFVLGCDTHVGKWIEETGRLDHDRWLLDLIEPLIPVGGTVIDVGALYGDHTIAYSRRVGPHGTVLAFEPNITAFRALVKNMRQFNCNNVSCFPTALGEHKGHAFLHVQHDNVGMTRVVDTFSDHVIMTESETLDDLKLRHLDFLKIDAEGEELNILKGGLKTLKRCRPILLMEVNRSRLALRNTSAEELIAFVNSAGYSGKPLQPDLTESAEQFDLLCHAG